MKTFFFPSIHAHQRPSACSPSQAPRCGVFGGMAARQPIPQHPRWELASRCRKTGEIPAKPIDTRPFYRGDNAILFPQKEKKRKIQSQTTEVCVFFKFSCYRFLGIKQLGVFFGKKSRTKISCVKPI